jgi:hypothetical protein
VWFGMSDDKSLAEMFGQDFVDMMTPSTPVDVAEPQRAPKHRTGW